MSTRGLCRGRLIVIVTLLCRAWKHYTSRQNGKSLNHAVRDLCHLCASMTPGFHRFLPDFPMESDALFASSGSERLRAVSFGMKSGCESVLFIIWINLNSTMAEIIEFHVAPTDRDVKVSSRLLSPGIIARYSCTTRALVRKLNAPLYLTPLQRDNTFMSKYWRNIRSRSVRRRLALLNY